jgi:hypothetical protein
MYEFRSVALRLFIKNREYSFPDMRNEKKTTADKTHLPPGTLPPFCDYSCRHAGFAPKEAVGDCRKELAVYCSFLKRFNVKNNRCLVPASK